MDPESYVNQLKSVLEPASNPSNAVPMKKYMKGKFEYLGIKSPERKSLLSTFLRHTGLPESNQVSPIIQNLWSLPEREFQYCGVEIARRMLKRMNVDFIQSIEFMITTKSWWDTVDIVAASLGGRFFLRFPKFIPDKPDVWVNSENMWLIRSAILYQLGYKGNTNLDILRRYILSNSGSKEFFIQKAIGWILREYSKTDSQWVIDFISSNKLAPLSEREGLKWLKNKGLLIDNKLNT